MGGFEAGGRVRFYIKVGPMGADLDVTLEIARIFRECERRVLDRIASRQLGEAWRDIDVKECGYDGGQISDA